jgi:hypothetical protein
MFFFEKKNQKTFDSLRLSLNDWPSRIAKERCGLRDSPAKSRIREWVFAKEMPGGLGGQALLPQSSFWLGLGL